MYDTMVKILHFTHVHWGCAFFAETNLTIETSLSKLRGLTRFAHYQWFTFRDISSTYVGILG